MIFKPVLVGRDYYLILWKSNNCYLLLWAAGLITCMHRGYYLLRLLYRRPDFTNHQIGFRAVLYFDATTPAMDNHMLHATCASVCSRWWTSTFRHTHAIEESMLAAALLHMMCRRPFYKKPECPITPYSLHVIAWNTFDGWGTSRWLTTANNSLPYSKNLS